MISPKRNGKIQREHVKDLHKHVIVLKIPFYTSNVGGVLLLVMQKMPFLFWHYYIRCAVHAIKQAMVTMVTAGGQGQRFQQGQHA